MNQRPIKFRAWDKENKQFWSGDFFFYLHLNGYLVEEVSGDSGEIEAINKTKEVNNRFILQQFTGLHDKNGKEVYEGDIVEIQFPKRTNTKNQRVKVEWIKSWIEPIIIGQWQESLIGIMVEVIGNIYESPQLFKD